MQIPFYDLKRVNSPYLEEIKHTMGEVVDSGWYIRGQYVDSFEQQLSEYLGVKHVVGVGNGLDALTLILRAYLEMGCMEPGDEVIVPSNTYIASVLAISEVGLVPVLVEPDLETYNIDVLKIKEHISSKTRAILAVNLYGLIADVKALQFLCKDRNLLLIEDNAQAAGAVLDKQQAGTFGHAAGFSFYPTKNLGALGDGGAVVTDNKDLANIVRALANYGSEKKYYNQYKGINSRLDEVQAAVLSLKLKHLDAENERRRSIAIRYVAGIDNPYIVMPDGDYDKNHVWHLFVIRTNDRERLVQYLDEKGVQTQVHYPVPIHKQSAYQELAFLDLPISEKIASEVLSLPMGPYMTDEEVDYVISTLNAY